MYPLSLATGSPRQYTRVIASASGSCVSDDAAKRHTALQDTRIGADAAVDADRQFGKCLVRRCVGGSNRAIFPHQSVAGNICGRVVIRFLVLDQ